MPEKLSQAEIVFLRSLSDSDLSKVLEEMPRPLATAAVTQLMGPQSTEVVSANIEKSKHEYMRKVRLSLQDIAPLPDAPFGKVAELRERCDSDLQFHLRTCYPNAFTLPFAPDHAKLVEQIQETCEAGGLKALAMPRGSGKTTIIMRAALWALLTGRRKFAVIVAATDSFAVNLLKGIKTEILANGMLHALYGQELHCLRSLEGESRRAGGQRFDGERTNVQWLLSQINFGYVPGVTTNGAILSTCGITGNIRGQQVTGADGLIRRPDIVLGDDLQTKDSAASPQQCEKRYEILLGDVLGMAGAKKRIAGLFSGTILYRDDMMHRLLDRKRTPLMRGECCKLVYKWSTEEKLWDQYRSVYEEEMRQDGDGSQAAWFVTEHYDELHQGSQVGWKERFDDNEVSALQHAWNLRIRDEVTFWAEYQNDPLSKMNEQPFEILADALVSRTNASPRLQVPAGCEKLTTFIDIQNRLLFFCQIAWEVNGRGHIINYGSFPDQQRYHYSRRTAPKTLQARFKTEDLGEAIYAGLDVLVGQIMDRTYERVDGRMMSMDRCGIDARAGQHTRIVRRFCRESKHMGRVHPQFGQFIGANSKPWHQWSHNPKREALGINCKLKAPAERGVAELIVDVNWWKSYAAEKLTCGPGADNAILLYEAEPFEHQMFADHCAAETPVIATGKAGNTCIEWRQDGAPDNDFFDCLVGCCVLSSIEGIKINIKDDGRKPARKRKRKPPPQHPPQTPEVVPL